MIILYWIVVLRFLLYPQRTKGFKTRLHRSDHFTKHRERLRLPGGWLYEVVYERMADDFVTRRIAGRNQDEFTRRWNGDVVRYDLNRNVLGIRDRAMFIKTHYRLDPSVHGFPTNLDYYLSEKGKA